jgi:hypothetical protein
MKSSLVLVLAATAVYTFCVQPARADDTNAVIPYETLDAMFQPVSEIDQTKLEVRMLVQSAKKTVHPSDITLTIHSASRGLIPVALGTNAQVLSFPHEKDLARENPPVIANQPKGTLRLVFVMQLPLPDGLTFRYNRLDDGVTEMNKAIRARAGWALSLLAPKTGGVVFLFPKTSAGKATVEIESTAGKKEFTADKDGCVRLKLEKSLLAENPEVTVSEKPEHIVPDMEDAK